MKKQFLIVIILMVITSGMVFSLNGVSAEPGISVQRESTLDWTQRFPENFPEPRHAHAMAYDSARGVTVLFGGTGNNTKYRDTWEWDGTEWTKLSPANSPPPLAYPAMTYDSVRNVVVLLEGKHFLMFQGPGNGTERTGIYDHQAINPQQDRVMPWLMMKKIK